MKLSEIARELDAEIVGEQKREIDGVSTLTEASASDLSFYHNPKYAQELAQTQAGAVLVPPGYPQLAAASIALIVENPYVAMTIAVKLLHPSRSYPHTIHPLTYVDENAQLADDVCVAPYVCIMAGAKVGSGTVLLPHSYIGYNAEVGVECKLYPHTALLDDCVLGDRVIMHSGAVVGSDGFGFAPSPTGYQKFPQVGRVVVGNDVELGANVTIDRGALGDTVVGDGVKLDNLVHLAHNVRVGKHTVMAAQAGISGSTTIGEWCVVGGQVGLVGHIEIGDRAQIGAQSGVIKDLPGDKAYFGTPTQELGKEMRSIAHYKKLDALAKRVRELEKKIEELTEESRD